MTAFRPALLPVVFALLAAVFITVACAPEPAPAVSAPRVDELRTISRDNAALNASAYARTVHGGEVERIIAQSDSTIGDECPNGDGWGSVTLLLKGGEQVPLQCQTNGSGKGIDGCMTKEDFAGKSYGAEAGKCVATADLAPLGAQ